MDLFILIPRTNNTHDLAIVYYAIVTFYSNLSFFLTVDSTQPFGEVLEKRLQKNELRVYSFIHVKQQFYYDKEKMKR